MNATVEYLLEALTVVTDKINHRDSVIANLSEQMKCLTKERDDWKARSEYSDKRRMEFYDKHEKFQYAAKLAVEAIRQAGLK